MAECIEHVARTNSLYIPPIKDAVARHASSGPADQTLRTAGRFSALFLYSVSPQGKAKLKSPPSTRPVSLDPSTIDPEQSLHNLVATHREICELLKSTASTDLNHIRFRNPFIPLLRFTIATGLLIMAAHGRRHLLQAETVSQLSGFPKSAGASQQSA